MERVVAIADSWPSTCLVREIRVYAIFKSEFRHYRRPPEALLTLISLLAATAAAVEKSSRSQDGGKKGADNVDLFSSFSESMYLLKIKTRDRDCTTSPSPRRAICVQA